VRSLDPDRATRDIGRRIAELRRQRELTQEQLSVRLGVTFQWVSQIEAGRNLTIHSLIRIANALNVSLAELVAPPKAASRARRRGRPPKSRTS
jgi:transcriptional regulator with XRE-family HTH domain